MTEEEVQTYSYEVDSKACMIHENSEEISLKADINFDEAIPIPVISPTYSGDDLKINAELVTVGLSAIAIKCEPPILKSSQEINTTLNKSDADNQGICFSDTYLQTNSTGRKLSKTPGSIQPRRSFYDLHHPELLKLRWTWKLPPEYRKRVIERFFHEHVSYHGPFCYSFHNAVCQQNPTIHGDSVSSSSEMKTSGSDTTDKDKSDKEINLVNYEKESLVTIKAPIEEEWPSFENFLWPEILRNDLSFPEFERGVEVKNRSGAGEEAETEILQTDLCGNDDDRRENNDNQISGVQGEDAPACTNLTTNGEFGFLYLLRRSPAKMNLANDVSSNFSEPQREGKQITFYKSLQEVSRKGGNKDEI